MQQLDTWRSLDHCFGVNQGRSLYEGVVDELDLKAHPIRAPNATRAVKSIGTAKGSPLPNYAALHAGLHTRLSWAEQGRGHQTKTSLQFLGFPPLFVCY